MFYIYKCWIGGDNLNNKYVFETDSSSEMKLVVARNKLLSLLYDLKDWRRNLYKGYDNDIRYLCDGKLYNYQEFEDNREKLPRDEHGFIKDCKHVYLEQDLINKIDDLISDVEYLIG